MFDRCTLDEVAAALSHIDADERDTWVRMGMAVHHEFGPDGFSVWDSWSQTAASYTQGDARNTYKSFKAKSGGVTVATLFEEAIRAGYQPDKQQISEADKGAREKDRARRAAERAERERIEAELEARWHQVIGEAAEKVWDDLETGGKSPYLFRKKIKPFGTRFVPHGIVIEFMPDRPGVEVITGRDSITEFFNRKTDETKFRYLKPGCLVVPMYWHEDGRLANLQIIYEAGKKSFLKHGRVSGCYFMIGDMRADDPLVFTEGFATAASIHMATGAPVVVAFNCNNLPVVAEALRPLFSDRHFVIAADDDQGTAGNPGLSKASEAAQLVDGRVWVPSLPGVSA